MWKTHFVLGKIKDRLFEIADSDIYLRTTLTKEGLEVYNAVKDYMKMGNDEVALQAKEGALLFAAHADVMASIIRKAGNSRFTAMDYYAQYIDMVVGKKRNADGFTQPINKDVNLSDQVTVVDVTHLLGNNVKNLTKKNLKNILKNSFKNVVVSADSKALLGVGNKINRDHITYNPTPRNITKSLLHNLEVLSLEELAKHAVLIDSIPNTKKGKNAHKAKVLRYHRFYVPMKVENNIYVIKIVGEERINNSKNNIVLNSLLIDLYDVKTEKKIPTVTVKNGAGRGTSSSLTISIREMLKDVKDYNGNPYINEDGTGNFAQLKEDVGNKYYQTAEKGDTE